MGVFDWWVGPFMGEKNQKSERGFYE
jgi:hypothetical protein